MAITEIRCDSCDRDLTYTSNSEDYRLALSSEDKTPWYVREGLESGAVTDIGWTPEIDRPHYFCEKNCLRTWLDK